MKGLTKADDTEEIKGFFSDMAEGIKEGLRKREIFDHMRDALRSLEGHEKSGKEWTHVCDVQMGRMMAFAQVLKILDAWPCEEYRERYRPRVIDLIERHKDK